MCQEHFTAHHAGRSPLVCESCGHIASTESRLVRHRATHLAERNREYCNICMKEFRNKVSLRTHKNMVHKMGKQYTCSYCGKILYSSQYVKKHEATHTGEKFKAVVCKYCGKTVEYTKVTQATIRLLSVRFTLICLFLAQEPRVDPHRREAVQMLGL